MALVSAVTSNEIMDELAIRLNEVSADESVVYLGWINQCTRDIAISFPNAPFLFTSADRTLSAGTRGYNNLPADFEKMILTTYPGGDVKLKNITEEEFAAIQPSASEQGTPIVYTIHGAYNPANSQIEYYPVPGSALTVNHLYRRLPTTVSAVSASLPIPIKYSELYVKFGEVKGLRRREDYDQADRVETQYEALKQKMIDDFKRITEEPWAVKSIRELTRFNKNYNNEIVNLFWSN